MARGHSSQCAYDFVGNIVTLTNRNNNPWQFQYDAAEQVDEDDLAVGKDQFGHLQSSGVAQLCHRPDATADFAVLRCLGAS